VFNTKGQRQPVVAGCLPQIARHVIDSFLITSYFQANSHLLTNLLLPVVFHKLQDMSSTHFSTHRTSKPIPLCWLSSTNCKTCHRLISQHIVLPSQFPFAGCLPQIARHVIDSSLNTSYFQANSPLPVVFHKLQYMSSTHFSTSHHIVLPSQLSFADTHVCCRFSSTNSNTCDEHDAVFASSVLNSSQGPNGG
jgi:hypothetical protein